MYPRPSSTSPVHACEEYTYEGDFIGVYGSSSYVGETHHCFLGFAGIVPAQGCIMIFYETTSLWIIMQPDLVYMLERALLRNRFNSIFFLLIMVRNTLTRLEHNRIKASVISLAIDTTGKSLLDLAELRVKPP